MKKISALFLSSLLLLTFFSCQKICDKKDKSETYYYSEDFKTSGASLNATQFSELNALWSVFFTEGKSKELRYKLVGEKDEKKDVIWEEGIVSSEGYDITFIPSDGSENYMATFNEKKDSYTVVFPEQEQREVSFILKEKK